MMALQPINFSTKLTFHSLNALETYVYMSSNSTMNVRARIQQYERNKHNGKCWKLMQDNKYRTKNRMENEKQNPDGLSHHTHTHSFTHTSSKFIAPPLKLDNRWYILCDIELWSLLYHGTIGRRKICVGTEIFVMRTTQSVSVISGPVMLSSILYLQWHTHILQLIPYFVFIPYFVQQYFKLRAISKISLNV